jgi:hypothetical protein
MTDDTSMWDDPQESSALRQLLRAGRVENSDYDVERGLARHLAQLQGGAPMPAWAVQSTLQKSASWSILAWLLPPVISAGVVGAWLALRPADPPLASLVMSAPQPAAAPLTESPITAPRLQPAPASNGVTAANPTANTASASTNVAADSSAGQERDVHDVNERHDHHNAVVRSTRQPVRATNARRGRSGRPDDVAPADTAQAASTHEGSSPGAGVAAPGSSSKAATDDSASKSNAKSELTAAAQESVPAPAEEARAKSERRSKEEESVAKVDEVSGARLEREMRMLAVAQRVLTEDPARSLRLCRQGESEFRGSMFSAERKQVALLALVQLGKVDQARREGIPFLRAFPNAPWSARLREALSSGRLPNP